MRFTRCLLSTREPESHHSGMPRGDTI